MRPDPTLRALHDAILAADGPIRVQVGAATYALPAAVVPALAAALRVVEGGDAPQVVRRRPWLTTQEAADLLGVSRMTVVRWIDEGELSAQKVGTHRRVPLAEVERWRANQAYEAFVASGQRLRRKELAALTALGVRR